MSADPVPPPTKYAGWTRCPDLFHMRIELLAGRKVRMRGKYSSVSLPKFMPGEEIVTVSEHLVQNGGVIMRLVRIITTLGNLYWYEGVINGDNVIIDSGDHITDTPLAPHMLAVVKNVYDCRLDTIKNVLEINKNLVTSRRF